MWKVFLESFGNRAQWKSHLVTVVTSSRWRCKTMWFSTFHTRYKWILFNLSFI